MTQTGLFSLAFGKFRWFRLDPVQTPTNLYVNWTILLAGVHFVRGLIRQQHQQCRLDLSVFSCVQYY